MDWLTHNIKASHGNTQKRNNDLGTTPPARNISLYKYRVSHFFSSALSSPDRTMQEKNSAGG